MTMNAYINISRTGIKATECVSWIEIINGIDQTEEGTECVSWIEIINGIDQTEEGTNATLVSNRRIIAASRKDRTRHCRFSNFCGW